MSDKLRFTPVRPVFARFPPLSRRRERVNPASRNPKFSTWSKGERGGREMRDKKTD